MKQLALNYFLAWNAQDATWLEKLFDQDIKITDWDNSASGLNDVIEMNKNIWKDVPNIWAEVLDIIEDDNACAAILKIHIGEETLKVIDLFTMKNGKITSINAYKG